MNDEIKKLEQKRETLSGLKVYNSDNPDIKNLIVEHMDHNEFRLGLEKKKIVFAEEQMIADKKAIEAEPLNDALTEVILKTPVTMVIDETKLDKKPT